MMTNNKNRMVIVTTDTWPLNVHEVHEGSRKLEFVDVTENVATFILAEDNSDLFHMRINPKCLSDVCNLSQNDWQNIFLFFDVIGICKSEEAIPLPIKGGLPFSTDSIIKIKPAQVHLDGSLYSKGEIYKKLSVFEETIIKKCRQMI